MNSADRPILFETKFQCNFISICRNFFRGRIIWPLRCGHWRDESIWQHAQPRGGDSHTAGLVGNSLLTGSSLWSHIVNVMDINKLQCSTMLFRKVELFSFIIDNVDNYCQCNSSPILWGKHPRANDCNVIVHLCWWLLLQCTAT